MGAKSLTLDKVLEEAGFYARAEARAQEKKALEIAKKMLESGFSEDQTVNLSGLTLEKIKTLLNK